MRVAFGTTLLEQGLARGGVDGIGHYSRELLTRLRQQRRLEVQPFVFSGTVPSTLNELPVRAGSFAAQSLYSLATGQPVPDRFSAFAGCFDLVHATDHLIPCVRKIPVVATLMDAVPLAHPEWVKYPLKGLKNALWKRTTQWAAHFVTISEHSKQELIQWFGIPEQRISITPLGVDQRWFEAPSQQELQRVRRQYDLPERFIVFVGTLQPRKNVTRLIAAHQMLPAPLRREFPLLVVGRAGWACEQEVRVLGDGGNGSLRWLRYVPDPDLLPLISQASVLVLPSLHEGFGLPVLEAFAAGVPVVAANTTSLPEVADSAAVLVDPLQVAEISDAMRRLATDETLSETMRRRGKKRAKLFSWDRTAEMTAEVYDQVLASL